MPSEPRTERSDTAPSTPHAVPGGGTDMVGRILSVLGEGHRSALASALEEARGILRTLRSSENGRAARVAGELGALAVGAVDPERFAALLDGGRRWDPDRVPRVEEAIAVLEDAVAESSRMREVTLEAGETLRDAVARALNVRGRAFGAVRALALLRTGAFVDGEHAGLLEGLPFGDWRTLERELAPSLLVSVDGAGLATVAGLAEFLDGGQKIVLRVEGRCPPAPLARLLTPGILVLQTDNEEALECLVGRSGPAVAALVPGAAACFVHDPDADDGEAGRLEIQRMPDSPPRGWIGAMSPAQQAEELRLLEAWTRRPASGDVAGARAVDRGATGEGEGKGLPATAPSSDPAELLAAWLLSQVDPDGAEET